MTDFDFTTFEKTFERVLIVFRLKLKPSEREQLTRTYFKILDQHAIEDVVAAGKRCVEKHRTFPKAADWLAELAHVTAAVCPPDRRQMGIGEADELARAEAMRFDDGPCYCDECVAAGVDGMPRRFVPLTVDGDELERAFNPRRARVEVVGHWAHGAELARWYAARDEFRSLTRRAPRTIAAAVAMLTGEREPGMEG